RGCALCAEGGGSRARPLQGSLFHAIALSAARRIDPLVGRSYAANPLRGAVQDAQPFIYLRRTCPKVGQTKNPMLDSIPDCQRQRRVHSAVSPAVIATGVEATQS